MYRATLICCLLSVMILPAGASSPTKPAPRPAPSAETVQQHEESVRETFVQRIASLPGRPDWGPLPLLQGRRQYLPLVKAGLASSEPIIRARATFILGLLRLPDTAPLAQQRLLDQQQAIRRLAGVTLSMLGDGQGLSDTQRMWQAGAEWQRYYALYALWSLNTRQSRRTLAGLSGNTPLLEACLKSAKAHRPNARTAFQAIPLPLELAKTPQTLQGLWEFCADAQTLESDFWWHKGNYDQAIRCQEAAIFVDTHLLDAYSNIAWLQWSMGRGEAAIRTYKRAITANPKSWRPAQDLGLHYLRLHNPAVALPYLRQAAKFGSPAVERRSLGHTLEKLGKTAEARQAWLQILKLDPRDPVATRQLERLKGR